MSKYIYYRNNTLGKNVKYYKLKLFVILIWQFQVVFLHKKTSNYNNKYKKIFQKELFKTISEKDKQTSSNQRLKSVRNFELQLSDYSRLNSMLQFA